ncbi:pre-mRNA-splicing factor SYF1, putative [Plasmodium gallinaceum]|uniref:Pre-mRNA-splicing factor SYF1, putative n=1 Tax=Plasmodium gallinaceum TaxID=5849 RepID=A0A1J1GX28_PLAGA|nr:pre-mRNA-splicing factor SYF1, putative [Plasmodium gallinaceum]CRG96996.1 pre-mRNA-splicing factor SYF1, putative [Plasmodium gallinaceum]
MELYGELYDCDDFFNEGNICDEDKLLEKRLIDNVCTENDNYVKNIELDIKNNLEKISTKYLFLYINKFKEKNIKNENSLYVLNFYDIHLRNDNSNILETNNNIIEYCITEIINKNNSKKEKNMNESSDNFLKEENEKNFNMFKYYLFKIYEIILKYFPFSFKLWYNYLKDNIEMIRDIYYDNKREYKRINSIFEKCLLYMYHFKSIYIMYIQFLFIQRNIQKIREIFNQSLQNVFLNQQEDIWYYQLKYNEKINNKLINYEYIKRYVTIYPEQIILLFNHYVKYKMHKHAINTFFFILNCEETLELGNKSKYDLYKEIFNLINSTKVLNNDVVEILKNNLNVLKNYENITSIYILLANNYVYEGRWNKAMDIYEEGFSECYTINDFSNLFENYIETLKILIDLKIDEQEKKKKKKKQTNEEENIEEEEEDEEDEEEDEEDEEEDEEDEDKNEEENDDKYEEEISQDEKENDDKDEEEISQDEKENDDKYDQNSAISTSSNNKKLKKSKKINDNFLIDLYIEKINYLLDKRKTFIADIKLKNNKNNVYIWLSKIDAIEDKDEKIDLFNKCLEYFQNNDYSGKLSDIYITYAYYHYNNNNYDESKKIFYRAIEEKNFKSLNEIASIFCSWVELELLQKNYKEALNIARLSIDISRDSHKKTLQNKNEESFNGLNGKIHTNFNLLNSIKLVCLILDMEINYGTIETSLNLFDLLYHSKSITVKMVLSFSNYLYEQKYFNECFKIYEKAISLFNYPYLYPIYINYINKYIERYKDKNISYVRELFKQAIYGMDNKTYIPKEFAKYIFLMYAMFEENYGFLKKSLSIYKEAIPFLEENDKIKFYKIFISKVSKSYGVHKAREAFEEAIQTLKDDNAREMCMLYIDMEYKLNEYERVRALYIYTAQFTNPLTQSDFYQAWREFEVLHGNEYTFRDMIRIKRSVLNIFSNSSNNIKEIEKNEKSGMNGIENTKKRLKEMIENEEQIQKKIKK